MFTIHCLPSFTVVYHHRLPSFPVVYHRLPFAARGKAVRKYQEMSPSEQRRNGDMLSESMPELSLLHEGEEETKDSHRKRAKRALHLHRNTGTSVGAYGGTGGGDGNKTSPLAKEQSTTTTAATTPVNCECFYRFSVVHRATNDSTIVKSTSMLIELFFAFPVAPTTPSMWTSRRSSSTMGEYFIIGHCCLSFYHFFCPVYKVHN